MQKDFLDLDITLLLEILHQKYGYDFRNYSEAHLIRRVVNRMVLSKIKDITELQARILQDPAFTSLLLSDLSITVTEMFRDPAFFVELRKQVIPVLKTYPFLKIWHAGCATGEEVYSMAILLKEEGLYERTTIYATDFNETALQKAREGIFPLERMKEYTQNYQKAGGREAFIDYYSSSYDMAIMDKQLKKNIVWANHNLVTDGVFAEVNLVMCRNVLIYFNRDLQNRVQQIFFESLVPGGILCLGAKESIRFSHIAEHYAEVDKKLRIFKKRY